MIKNYLLSFLCLFLSIGLYSQVEIIGDIKLGDTTQVHQLNTKKGDRLVGRVIGFDDVNIHFLMLGNRLSFPLSEVDHVLVRGDEEQNERSLLKQKIENSFNYEIRTQSGEVYLAAFQSYKSNKIEIKTKDDQLLTFQINDIQSINYQPDSSQTQSSIVPKYHRVKLFQSSFLIGQVLSYEDGVWKLKVIDNKVLSFKDKQLFRIDFLLDDELENKYNDQNPAFSKYGNNPMRRYTKNFIAPTGFMLSKGETEYRNTEIFFNSLEHGITDNFTIGTSLSSIFLVNSLSVKTKIGASLSPKLHVAAGGQLFYFFGRDVENSPLTNYFATFTLGSIENNLSVSLGRLANVDGDNFATITMAGSIRTGKKSRIFVEYNRFDENEYDEDYLIFNAGVSWFNRDNRVDFGISVIDDEYDIVPLPIAAFSHYF